MDTINAAAAPMHAESRPGRGSERLPLFAVGAITAGIVGFLAVKYFLRYIVGHSLTAFAWYRFALAAVFFIILYL